MAQPFVGEIRMFGGSFAPQGWEFCDGRPLPISENDVLFQLIGTTYGGDGEETFNLPDLRGRLPMHVGMAPSGTTYQIGEMAGVEQVTLTSQQIPSHNHPVPVANSADVSTPNGIAIFANEATIAPGVNIYAPPGNQVAMAPAMVQMTGGFQPHENVQPFLCISFIISLFGVFPSQT